MIEAIIVDDELKSREVIKTLVENFCPTVKIVAMAEDIVGAIHQINTHKPGLVFLDISLKEGDSFQILQQLDEINFEIIFVTAYDEYSIKALKYSGITCLFKPLDIDELQNAVDQVSKKNTNMNTAYQMVDGILKSKFTKIPVITDTGLVFTPVEEITYIQKSDGGCRIHFNKTQPVKSKRNLTEFEDIILNAQFNKIGNNTLINTSQLDVNKLLRRQIVFKNGQTITLSNSDETKFFENIKSGN